MSNKYQEFIHRKSQLDGNFGFEPSWLPDYLFDFQVALLEWAIKKGRSALFTDCGTGKTIMELVWAQNVYQHTGKPVLILSPLAVAAQSVKEAEKFGIEAARSHRGEVDAPIVIINYERLHLLDTEQFGGIVCDECFVGDTPIDTLEGTKRIADIKVGEYIYTAAGLQKVRAKKKRYKKSLVLTSIQGYDIISSENHPFLTQRGWVKAKNLTEDDCVIYTSDAMRMVREGTYRDTNQETFVRDEEETRQESFLREVLLCEMENDTTRNLSESTFTRSSGETGREEECMVQEGQSKGFERTGTHTSVESNDRPCCKRESIETVEGNRTQTLYSGRKWQANADTSKNALGSIGEGLDSGIHTITREKTTELSDPLQNRHSKSEVNGSSRGGRIQPCCNQTQTTRCKERREIAGARVDSVAVYESNDSIFRRYRDETGRVALYDLEVKGHPSYSINGLLVHNSSILKSFDGVRRGEITELMRLKPYRLLGTATAAPNDYIELGTSSEALGYLGHMDMLGRFFTNRKRTSRQMKGRWRDGKNGWRFKGHAEQAFWRWVSSWARALRSPSDFGFDDDGFILPDLNITQHMVEAQTPPPGMLFNLPAVGWREQRAERRRTLPERCEMAASLVANTGKPAVVWCSYNAEGDLLTKLIPDAQQVSGRDSNESKEEKLEAFSNSKIRVLVTKPKIGAWGLNWQHCNHLTWFPSNSYEQYYQAVRRCWRFGQQNPVTVDIVMTEGERFVQNNMEKKAKAADEMFTALVAHMNSAVEIDRLNTYDTQMEVPKWL